MTTVPRRPVLIVEGDGDRIAVPELIRRLAANHQVYPVARPLRGGDVTKLQRPGQLERFLEYACRRPEGDSVLVLLDCDDDCPVEVAKKLTARAVPIGERHQKPIGLVLLHREFETLFLLSLKSIAAKLKLDVDFEALPPVDALRERRGAKEALRAAIRPAGSTQPRQPTPETFEWRGEPPDRVRRDLHRLVHEGRV